LTLAQALAPQHAGRKKMQQGNCPSTDIRPDILKLAEGLQKGEYPEHPFWASRYEQARQAIWQPLNAARHYHFIVFFPSHL